MRLLKSSLIATASLILLFVGCLMIAGGWTPPGGWDSFTFNLNPYTGESVIFQASPSNSTTFFQVKNVAGTSILTVDTTNGLVNFNDGNITNVGDIALDSLTADDGTGPIIVNDEIEFQDGEKLLFGTGSDGAIYSSSDNLYIENDTTDKDIIFKVSDNGVDTTVMTIDGDVSRVGIGTATPAEKLHVVGNLQIQSGNLIVPQSQVLYSGNFNYPYLQWVGSSPYDLDIDIGQGSSSIKIGDIGGTDEYIRISPVGVITGGSAATAGAEPKVKIIPRVLLYPTGVLTDGTTETTAYIDSTPTGEWVEIDAGTNVLVTADTDYYKDNTNSVKVAFTATAVAGDGVDGTIVADDLTNNESTGLWIRATAALTAGDFELVLDDDDASPDPSYNIPAVATANQWTWVEIDISGCQGAGNDCNVVDGIKVLMTSQGATNLGAVSIYLDAMYKWDADDEIALAQDILTDGVFSVLSIVNADGQAHTFTAKTEYTNFFTNYGAGATDNLVVISDESANNWIIAYAYD